MALIIFNLLLIPERLLKPITDVTKDLSHTGRYFG